jgi:hypothetical protein
MRSLVISLVLLSSTAFAADPPAAPPVAPPTAAPPKSEPRKVPRLSKQAIGACGCSLYAPEGFSVGAPQKSDDGSDVYTGSVKVDGWEFGVIAVKFGSDLGNDGDANEAMLLSYLEFLKTQLDITGAVGVGKGHKLDSNPNARGVIDFWKDKDGDDWAVKAWVDGKHLGVLYVAGKGDYPIYNVQQLFLDGFRFE